MLTTSSNRFGNFDWRDLRETTNRYQQKRQRSSKKLSKAGVQTAANRLPNHVCDRRKMIDFPEFHTMNCHIDSGPTKSRCKTSPQRTKGYVRRWNASPNKLLP